MHLSSLKGYPYFDIAKDTENGYEWTFIDNEFILRNLANTYPGTTFPTP